MLAQRPREQVHAQFVEAIRDFHAYGRPLVADMAGGFAALGAGTFGAVRGNKPRCRAEEILKHQIGKKPPSGGGGASLRVYVHELDRYFKEEQLQAIFNAKVVKLAFWMQRHQMLSSWKRRHD